MPDIRLPTERPADPRLGAAPPAPTAVAPRPATFRDILEGEAQSQGIHPAAAVAIFLNENPGFDPDSAFPGPFADPNYRVSPRGARGPMQLMPPTAARNKANIDDPYDNIRGGVAELAALHKAHNNDLDLVARRYNGSPQADPKLTDGYAASFLANLDKESVRWQNRAATAAPAPATPATPPPKPAGGLGTFGAASAKLFSEHALPAVGTFANEATQSIRPDKIIAGTYQALRHPIVTGKAMWQGHVDLKKEADDAFAKGEIGVGMLKAVEAAIPLLGPHMKRVEEAFLAGDRAKGFGLMADIAGMAYAPKLYGKVATTVGKKALAPFKDSVQPFAKEAIDTFTDPSGKTLLMPQEVSTNRFLGVMGNIAGASVFGGGPVAMMKAARQAHADNLVMRQLGTLGPAPKVRAVGQGIGDAHAAATKVFSAESKVKWGQFEELGDHITAPMPLLDKLTETLVSQRGSFLPNAGMRAAQEVAKLAGMFDDADNLATGAAKAKPPAGIGAATPPPKPSAPGAAPAAAAPGTTAIAPTKPARPPATSVEEALQYAEQDWIADQLAGKPPPPPLTATEAHRVVSDLGSLQAQLAKAKALDPKHTRAHGIAVQMYKAAAKDLDDVLFKTSAPAHRLYTEARAYTRMGMKDLFNEDVRKMVALSPDKLAKNLVVPNNSAAVEAVHTAVGEAAFAPLRAYALEKVIKDTRGAAGVLKWRQLGKKLDTLEDTAEAMWPKGQAAEIRRVVKQVEQVNHKPAGDVGVFSTQVSQGAGVASLGLGNFSMRVFALMGIPRLLAKILTSQRGLKLLTTGLTAPPGSRAAATAAANFEAFINALPPEQEEQPPTPLAPGQAEPPPVPSTLARSPTP